jgi:NAD(P)-dependent dehydrogenase (short-subunit alcohol dehydrogenase family)
VEWGAYGIRVNCLAPSQFYHTDYRADFQALGASGTMENEADKRTPAGRGGRLQEFGWAATYLCSPYASYVSGHTLILDGGGANRTSFRYPTYVPLPEEIGAGLRQ